MSKKQKQQARRVCDDCRYATWDGKFVNMDIYGKPTLLVCKFKAIKIVRGTKACGLYINK